MKNIFSLFAILICFASTIDNQSSHASRDNNLALGNPSDAKTTLTSLNNYLLIKPQYALSYNSSKGIPNWVSWHLSSAWKGNYKRTDPFRADPDLPPQLSIVKKKDYTKSGFDKGHMCPSDDRDANKVDNDATFYMDNMIPQSPVCNQQTWGDLEDYCRALAKDGKELYIVAGQHGIGGSGSKGEAVTIANGKIEVPAFVWKVILVLENGENDLTRINTSTRTIAVQMPNSQLVNKHKWFEYRISVDSVEKLTQYNFYSLIDDSIEEKIESKVDHHTIH